MTTSIDVVIKEGKDLQLNPQNNLEFIAGDASLITQMSRRISTGRYGYTRFVESGGQFVVVNPNYGSDIYNTLAQPDTPALHDSIQKAIFDSAAFDNRLNIVNAQVETVGLGSVRAQITFNTTGSLQQATITL